MPVCGRSAHVGGRQRLVPIDALARNVKAGIEHYSPTGRALSSVPTLARRAAVEPRDALNRS